MAAASPTEEHRSSENPRVTMRKQEFRQLNRIQRELEKRWKTVEFDDETLQQLSIVQGSLFDIDQDDPIDLDPRFFLPGPVETMEKGLEALLQADGLEYCRWPKVPPIQNHRLQNGDELQHKNASRSAEDDAITRGGFCELAAEKSVSGWRRHQYMPPDKIPYCSKVWTSPQNGRPCCNNFTSGRFYMWPRSSDELDYHPNVPHAMATVFDAARPRQQGLLRSELLVAAALLKAQIRWPDRYVDHYVYPVLVMSFHGRFSARVIQAYFHNGRIVIRSSRLVNLYTRVVSPEVRLLIRWLNSRAVGDTRLPVPEEQSFRDPVDSSVEATDVKGTLSHTIPVR
ncbi:hypothetical protein FALBO_6232 [Fusarium albosuccineum]|uniref:Uncharacterized protein n=1 Tax=Fusarium albosuccineum TaxID=1237068 RepID=A0A8H4P926_9HYPO|nr:hypothetical protein FALBO_6232 [Fusarium albosuccineum]